MLFIHVAIYEFNQVILEAALPYTDSIENTKLIGANFVFWIESVHGIVLLPKVPD